MISLLFCAWRQRRQHRVLIHSPGSWLLSRSPGRRFCRGSPDPWNQTKKVRDFMTREQKRRARRGALYIMFLTVLALLLAAMVTS